MYHTATPPPITQVWKRDMLEQLEAVAAEEGEAKRLRLASERQRELDDWAKRRREQLERLIEVTRQKIIRGENEN